MDYYRVSTEKTGEIGHKTLPLPFPGHEGSGSETRFFLKADETGLTLVAEAEFSGVLASRDRSPKGRVFEDDCLELFLRPQISPENPFPAAFYFGWEVNPAGNLLEYRAGIGAEGERMIGNGSGLSVADGSGAKPGVEPVFGILRDEICGVKIAFDYDWHSGALIKTELLRESEGKVPGLWRLALCVPWSDFGLSGFPAGERWYFTVNRIDRSAAPGRDGPAGKPGLATLLSGTDIPAFHQPDSFMPLEFGV